MMKYEKSIKYFLFLALIWISSITIAQNKVNAGNYNFIENKKIYKMISFGDKIDFGNIDAAVRWTIINSKQGINLTLSGNQINNYSFDEPGEYEILFLETKGLNDECSHAMFPAKMIIQVSPVKLSFDFSKIKLSEKLVKGKNYTDLIITVPTKITVKDNSIATLLTPGMTISGVGVSLVAVALNSDVTVKDGIQLLKYKVSGLINKDTYVMFDFYDFSNQVQTYNLSQIIN